MKTRTRISLLILSLTILLTPISARSGSISLQAGAVPVLQSPTLAATVYNICDAIPRLEAAETKLATLIGQGVVSARVGNFLLTLIDRALTLLQGRCG
jgi:hypothetical protein